MIVSARRSYSVTTRKQPVWEERRRTSQEVLARQMQYGQLAGVDPRTLVDHPFFKSEHTVCVSNETITERHFKGILVHVKEQDGREYMQVIDES